MAKRKKEFDQTVYFKLLKDCVEKSDEPREEKELAKSIVEKFGNGFGINVMNIIDELYHKSITMHANKKEGQYYTMKFETLYKYVEMIELKESRIASKQANNKAMIAIAIAVASLLTAIVTMYLQNL